MLIQRCQSSPMWHSSGSRMGREFVKPSPLLYIWWQIDFLWSQCLGFGASYRCGRWMDVLSWEWVLEIIMGGGVRGVLLSQLHRDGYHVNVWPIALSFDTALCLNHKHLSQMCMQKEQRSWTAKLHCIVVICLSVFVFLSVCLSICPSIHLSVYWFICLSILLSICLFVYLFICPCVHLPI